MKKSVIDKICWWLIIIGALNWGLIGLVNLNVVALIFGMTLIARIIYIVVGAAAVYTLIMAFRTPRTIP